MNTNVIRTPNELFSSVMTDKVAVDIQVSINEILDANNSDLCRGLILEVDLLPIYKKFELDWSIVQTYVGLILSQKGYRVKSKGSTNLEISIRI